MNLFPPEELVRSMKHVKHNNDVAAAIARAAEMKSVRYLKQEAVRLARLLGTELPKIGS